MSFKKNKFCVIKKAISEELALFLYNYFSMQKQVYDTCMKERYISPFETFLGYYEKEDGQVPHTYSQYANIAFETLLLKIQPVMEKETKLKLYPNYSYARIYKHGDELKRHIDRKSCEISTTLNLGGDEWPIYVKSKNKEIQFNLSPGDMLVYRGSELEHWREPFKGSECVQVFLHYNNSKTEGSLENIFDTRIHLGLTQWFRKW